ncbi:MAG: hypothetical protein R3B90_07470 [Planctomycetaceae bacterium]
MHATAADLDGGIIWQTPLGPFHPKFGYAPPSPVLHEGLVIFAADNDGAELHRRPKSAVGRDRLAESAGTPAQATRPRTSFRSRRFEQLIIGGLDQLASYEQDETKHQQTWPVCRKAMRRNKPRLAWGIECTPAAGGVSRFPHAVRRCRPVRSGETGEGVTNSR